MSLVSFLLQLPTPSSPPPAATTGHYRQVQSEARIGGYLRGRRPTTVARMAAALGYTKAGLRLVMKALAARGKAAVVGYAPGYKGRKVALWKWIGD